MATYSIGANGAFPGKVGRVIGSNRRSREYPEGAVKKSSKPGTELQPLKANRYFADRTIKKGAGNDWPGLLMRKRLFT